VLTKVGSRHCKRRGPQVSTEPYRQGRACQQQNLRRPRCAASGGASLGSSLVMQSCRWWTHRCDGCRDGSGSSLTSRPLLLLAGCRKCCDSAIAELSRIGSDGGSLVLVRLGCVHTCWG
jgi:hypothetical protein